MNTLAAQAWVMGDHYGLEIPAHMDALAERGTEFLTAAFRASGALAPDNEVTALSEISECPGGSTGRKHFLTVAYRHPAAELPAKLFVKFSRDFSSEFRDRGKDQLESEVRLAWVSRHKNFPITVPIAMFGDYHHESGTGLVITERIFLGQGNVEPHHEKCLDYEVPDALEHYRTVITANARLAGTHKAGLLGDLSHVFPYDAAAAELSDPMRYDTRQILNRIARLGAFAAEFPKLFPAHVTAPEFLDQLREEMPRFLEKHARIKAFLARDMDYVALHHWNANIDNAWFWRGPEGALHCGLMDWGRVGQMNAGYALWGSLSGAEMAMMDTELDNLLGLYIREYTGHGGPAIGLEKLQAHMFLYLATMSMSWLIDAPPVIRAQIPDLSPEHDRFDIRFRNNETARSQLHMLTNVLNLWKTRGFGAVLEKFV